MKKTVWIIISVILIFMMISCSANEETEFSGSMDVSDEMNFGGLEITFTSDNDYNNIANGIFGYRYETPLYDSILSRMNSINGKYNCTIKNTSLSSFTSALPAAMASQISLGDAFFLDGYQFRSVANSGYILDLQIYSDVIDVTDSFRWGEQNVLELLCCKGHLCGVTPASWIDNLPPYYFILVSNNDILKRNAFNNPHEYYESGKWNRELFEDIVRECTDLEREIYGVDTSNDFILRMAVYSNGIGLLDSKSDISRSAWHEPGFTACLEWGYGFVQRNSDSITGGGESYEVFMNGRCAFALTAVYHLLKTIVFSDNIEEYSLVPFPCSDDCEPGTSGGFFSTGIATVSIPADSTFETETATVINELFAPMDGYDTREKLDQYYTSSIFFDPLDIQILHDVARKTEYNYWVENVNKPFEDLINVVISGKQTPSQAIESKIDNLDSLLEEIVIPNREGLVTYFTGNN